MPSHMDKAKDKSVVKKAVHKHEKTMHPGKPLTKLKKGGMPKAMMMQKKAGRGR